MKKNVLIAFSGMDGSGKTTIAKMIAAHLKKGGHPVFYKHAHGYTVSNNSFAVGEGDIRKFRILFSLLSPFMLLDSYYTYFFKYKPQLKKSSVICDRYFTDKIARLLYYGVINEFFAGLYLALLPKPDYLFYLDITPKNAKLRKNEYSIAEYEKFRKIYQFIATKTKTKAINVNQSLEIVFQKIANLVL